MMSIGAWDIIDTEVYFRKALQPSRCHNPNSQLIELSIFTAGKAHITGQFFKNKNKQLCSTTWLSIRYFSSMLLSGLLKQDFELLLNVLAWPIMHFSCVLDGYTEDMRKHSCL